MTVTGEMATPAATAKITAGASVMMFEYDFKLDGQLVPGPQVLRAANR